MTKQTGCHPRGDALFFSTIRHHHGFQRIPAGGSWVQATQSPLGTGQEPHDTGHLPSRCPAYGFFGGATLSSRPCDMNVASPGLLPGPACDSRAASGNRLQAVNLCNEKGGSRSRPGRQDAVRGVVGCVVDNGCHVVGIHLRCGIGRQERLEPPNVALRGI